MSLVPEYEVKPGVFYFHKLDHRDGTPEKSQWYNSVALEQERDCFVQGYLVAVVPKYDRNSKFLYNRCWGLHLNNEQVEYLGKTRETKPPVRETFVAIFDDNTSNKWHGYPADVCRDIDDIPPKEVRDVWLRNKFFNTAQIRRLTQGKLCKL